MSIAFSYYIVCSPDNYLILESIFLSSAAFCDVLPSVSALFENAKNVLLAS